MTRPLQVAMLGASRIAWAVTIVPLDPRGDRTCGSRGHSPARAMPRSASMPVSHGGAAAAAGVAITADRGACARGCHGRDRVHAAAGVGPARGALCGTRSCAHGDRHDRSRRRRATARDRGGRAKSIPIVLAPEHESRRERAARGLPSWRRARWTRTTTPEIHEAHHSPEGRCSKRNRAGARSCGRGGAAADPRVGVAILTRQGQHRPDGRGGAIGFSVVRGGDIVGDHRLIVRGSTVSSSSLRITRRTAPGFARGALAAARWVGRPPGALPMRDVLGI